MDDRWSIILISLIVVALVSFIIALFFFNPSDGITLSGAKVAVIDVHGPIVYESPSSFVKQAQAVKIVEQIERAEKDKSVKAILIDINSPGGTVVASKKIGDALKKVDKPVVGLIHELGASGGYWIASATDHIIADSMSVTGSVGVVASSLGFEDFIDEYNVSYRQLIAGEYKDAGSPFKEFTEEERALFQERIDLIHEAFIDEISENRKMPEEKVREVATGIFYLGSQAKDLGLVDELGGKSEAEDYLKKKLNISEVNFKNFKKQQSFLDTLAGIFQNSFINVGRGFALGIDQVKNENSELSIRI